jgi:hypothetical protein
MSTSEPVRDLKRAEAERTLGLPDRKSGSRLPLLLGILGLLTAVRLVGLTYSGVELFDDEAQYWSWGRDLAFGYYSKPPLLAWLIAATTHVCGDAEWCVRSPAPVFYFATSVVVFFAARKFYDERTAFWAALLTGLSTGIVFSSRIMTTDVPLLFFWTVALLAYGNLLARPDKKWTVLLGVVIGLGLLSKYAMIYFIPGMLLAALVSLPARNLLKTPAPWIALVIGAIVVAPNIVWNIQNGLTTFHHTGGLVLDQKFRLNGASLLEFLGSQFGVFGPVVFATMIVAIFRFRSAMLVPQDRVMIAFFITPLVLVTLVSIFAKAYANWASVSLVSGVILTAALLLRGARQFWLKLSIGLGIVMQAGLLTTDTLAMQLRLPFGIGNPYHRVIGLKAFAERIGHLAEDSGARSIVSDDRGKFAVLRYYWRDKPVQILSWGTTDIPSFDNAHPLGPSSPQPIMLFSGCDSGARVRPFFNDVRPLGLYTVLLGGGADRYFWAVVASDPRGPIGPLQACPRRPDR